MEAIPLTLGGMQSLSNRVQEPTVSIELHEGTLLLCRYTIPMNDGGSLLWRNKD
jgi:thiamine pyrophosphokinase